MDLTEIERAFLKQLSLEPRISTPLFDHELVARLVELGLIDVIPQKIGRNRIPNYRGGPHGFEWVTVQLGTNMRSPSQKLGDILPLGQRVCIFRIDSSWSLSHAPRSGVYA